MLQGYQPKINKGANCNASWPKPDGGICPFNASKAVAIYIYRVVKGKFQLPGLTKKPINTEEMAVIEIKKPEKPRYRYILRIAFTGGPALAEGTAIPLFHVVQGGVGRIFRLVHRVAASSIAQATFG